MHIPQKIIKYVVVISKINKEKMDLLYFIGVKIYLFYLHPLNNIHLIFIFGLLKIQTNLNTEIFSFADDTAILLSEQTIDALFVKQIKF